ncbi:MAG: ABC transporter permease [Terrabacter sp.]|nr:ABC transporter permease [Dermatophilaceae bacterium]NUO91632.1 ABC transporter permease [Dermatophilaceae bacterium]NUR16389.1 ABC transporter permease [Dermatophilaceae bacterium]NUR79041.1 ABC transporter permease [Dermatophilaceae bacterium]NUS40956.1 ABC transporter permease [Terrabacter sp.]
MTTAIAASAREAGDPQLTPPRRGGRRRGWMPYVLLLPGLLWLTLFFIVPLVQLGSASLQSQWPGAPGYYYRDVNGANYLDALSAYGVHFLRSLAFAGMATVLCFAIAFPLAYAMAFKAGRWRNVMLILVVAPFFTSFILRTIAWRQILADEGPLARTLNALHLLPGGHITETWVAVVAGLTYNFLPFMVLPIYTSLERADPRLLEAGRDLYADRLTTLRTVTIPLAAPGILAGTLLTFIPAAGDYVNAELLGSDTSTKMVGNVINSQFFTVLGGYPTAAALSISLMVLILVLVLGYVRRFGTEEVL